MRREDRPGDRVVLASVGTMMPDDQRFHGPQFNRASQMFHEGLLEGLAGAGLSPDVVFSLEPIAAFPRDRRLFRPPARFSTPHGWPLRLIPFLNVHPFKWLSAGLSVFAALLVWSWRHRGRARVVHCINVSMPPGIFVWLAARLTGARALVSVLDVFRPGALVPDTLYRRLDFALHRWLLPRFDGVMVVSDAISEDFVPHRRVCRVEGGVKAEAFAVRRAPCRTGEGPFRVVLSGSLEPYNGVRLALQAFSLLPSGYQLIIAGRGSLTDEVRDSATRDPRIVYRGFLDFEGVLDLYARADLALNLRLTQSLDTRYFFPSKLMELVASGTPVLSTCAGHIEQEYGGVIYLLRNETPQALAEAITAIAARPLEERVGLGVRARDFMMAEKTWSRQGEKLARYVRTELLGER